MNIAIVGTGAMGKVVKAVAEERDEVRCVAFTEPMKGESLEHIQEQIDVIIDFSHPNNLSMIEEYARKEKCGVVIATTGFNDEELARIAALAQEVPVVQTANYSLGITVIKRILEQITPVLEDDFDIEIIEKHHRKKLDAPSGTAKLLANAINKNGRFRFVYGREGSGKRAEEIGVHAVRAGTIAGEHAVLFAGEDEIIEIKHTADSKRIFAVGALRAAAFLQEKMCKEEGSTQTGSGLYTMEDVLFPEEDKKG